MYYAEHYTTVVVGAGPSGVMAAYEASRAGDVLLIDALCRPREKSCGGMLNEYSQSFLKSVEGLEEIPDEIICKPEQLTFRFVDWDRSIRKASTLHFVNVDRQGFDEWLLGILPDTVTIAPSTRLTEIIANDENGVAVRVGDADEREAPTIAITCDYLVGCDGPRSTVRRCLPVSQLSCYKTLQDFIPLTQEIDPYFDCLYTKSLGPTYGYGYVVPKGDYALVGSVFYPGTKGCLEAHEQAIGLYRMRYRYAEAREKREAWTAVQVKSVSDIVGGHGRVLLAGEAGGIMSPSSGEGISFALNSGKLAGEAVEAALHEGSDALDTYRASLKPIKRNISRRLRYRPVLDSDWGKWIAGKMPLSIVDAVAHRI